MNTNNCHVTYILQSDWLNSLLLDNNMQNGCPRDLISSISLDEFNASRKQLRNLLILGTKNNSKDTYLGHRIQ